MNTIFRHDGHVMRALSDLSALIFLNILTLLFSIPVFTAGAALAALHAMVMGLIEGRGGNLFHDYRRRFFENLKNATPLWLLLLAASFFLYADCRIIVSGIIRLPRIALIPLLAAALLTGAVSSYVFPLTARYQFTTKDALRNAAILAVACLPRTVLMLLAGVVIPWLFWNVTRLLPLFFVLGISLPCYLQALLYLPVFEKIKIKEEPDATEGGVHGSVME